LKWQPKVAPHLSSLKKKTLLSDQATVVSFQSLSSFTICEAYNFLFKFSKIFLCELSISGFVNFFFNYGDLQFYRLYEGGCHSCFKIRQGQVTIVSQKLPIYRVSRKFAGVLFSELVFSSYLEQQRSNIFNFYFTI